MTKKPLQAFEPFSWLSDDAQSFESDFVETAYDISKGITMILDMIQTSQLAEDAMEAGCDCVPILGGQAREDMLLFARQSANLLREKAWENIEMRNDSKRNGGRSA